AAAHLLAAGQAADLVPVRALDAGVAGAVVVEPPPERLGVEALGLLQVGDGDLHVVQGVVLWCGHARHCPGGGGRPAPRRARGRWAGPEPAACAEGPWGFRMTASARCSTRDPPRRSAPAPLRGGAGRVGAALCGATASGRVGAVVAVLLVGDA